MASCRVTVTPASNMQDLRQFLDKLKQQPEEKPLEPELKAEKKERDRKIKEEQDLQAGAVLEATLEAGQGSETPQEGDLVYVHYSIRNTDDDLLYTTWAENGGSGQPLAFILGKGWRAPRAWELAVQGMTRNMRKRLKVQPGYGYQHPECRMAPAAAVPAKQALQFELQLVNWYPKDQVRACGEDSTTFKRVLLESDKWEVARAPNEVTFSIEARTPAYDGNQLTGFKYHSSSSPLILQLGQGQLPPGLEAALSYMSKGEKAVFVLPAEQMTMAAAAAGNSSSQQQPQQQQSELLIPPPPAKAAQVELCVELHDLVQVRDMTGDGQVTKKRLLEGHGEFPVDCPLHDTTVVVHYRVRQLTSSSTPGPWLHDTTMQPGSSSKGTSGSGDAGSDAAWGVAAGGGADESATARAAAGGAVEADTGCGELPEGLEMCVKLMVPGEVASAVCQPRYGYQGRSDAPVGLDPGSPVEFQVVLLSFEREGYWQHLSWQERWSLAEKLKDKGNALFKDKKYAYASNRYTHLLRLIESTRDFEEQEQVDKADTYKATLLSNLALVAYQQEEYARAVEWCDKALQMEPDSAKVLFRKGKALSMKGDYEEAEEQLEAAALVDPAVRADVEAAKAANSQRAKAAAAKQKQQFKNFFGKA